MRLYADSNTHAFGYCVFLCGQKGSASMSPIMLVLPMPRPVTEMFNALFVVINRDIFLPSTPFLLLMLCNKKCLKCITST